MEKTKEDIKAAYYAGYEEGYKTQTYKILMMLENNTPIKKIKSILMEDMD